MYDQKTFGFKQLYLKLVFEQMLQDIPINHDFELIYEFIKSFGTELTAVNIKPMDKSSLKCNNYWLLGIIPKLTSLKSLTLMLHESIYNNADFFKFLQKSFQYFEKNGGKLHNIGFNLA